MLPLLLAAALAASPAGRAYPAANFDRVALDAAADVTIATGPGFAVRATGDPAMLAQLTATVRDGTLVLGWSRGGPIRDAHGLKVAVTMPRLAGIKVSGAGDVVADRAGGETFEATVAGAGNVRIRTLQAARTRLVTSGAGDIHVAGRTNAIEASVTGVGTIDAGALAARQGVLDMRGTGSIAARVDGPVRVTLSGVGEINVAGAARCDIRKRGIGTVRCGDRA